jgi:hypothetical protein
METIRSSETLKNFYENKRRHIPESNTPFFVSLYPPHISTSRQFWWQRVGVFFMSDTAYLCLLNQYALPALFSNYKLQCPFHDYGVPDVLVLDEPYFGVKASSYCQSLTRITVRNFLIAANSII